MKKQKNQIMLIVSILLISSMLTAGCGTSADSYINEGVQALEEQDFESALRSFQYAINTGKSNMQAHRGAGIAYLGMGDYDMAIASFAKALLEKSAGKDDVKIDILYYKAAAEYNNQEYGNAVSSYTKIMAIREEVAACYLRGIASLANKDADGARADFSRAVELSPRDYDMYIGIYEKLKEAGYEEDGIEYLKKALQSGIAEDQEGNAYQVGLIYYYMGDFESAKDLLDAAIGKGEYEAALVLGQVYLALGDVASAEGAYQRYITERGESSRGYNGLVLCRLAAEDYEGAVNLVQMGLKADDDGGIQSLLFNEIVAYEKMGDLSLALEKAERYAEQYPGDDAGARELDFLKTRVG